MCVAHVPSLVPDCLTTAKTLGLPWRARLSISMYALTEAASSPNLVHLPGRTEAASSVGGAVRFFRTALNYRMKNFCAVAGESLHLDAVAGPWGDVFNTHGSEGLLP